MKWRSADCPKNGLLEVTGNLFLRLKCCEPRCEDYQDRECSVEKMFNAAALHPVDGAAGADSICCFNEKLFDYGELKSFEMLCSYYKLVQRNNNGKIYYLGSAQNWLALLKNDRKLMFAIFARTTESISYQHAQIFGGLNNHWGELISQDPAFYIDFRRMKQHHPKLHLDTQLWVGLCLEHRELYGQLLADGECEFSDLQLASLLARYPDLDDPAYEDLKKTATGEVWMRLLYGGVDEEHEKFWNDCDFSSLSGAQWLSLLSNDLTRDKALERLNDGKYSSSFTDADWKAMRGNDHLKALKGNIKFRPNGRNFTSFFRFAPQHAAHAQFSGMIGISLTVAVLGMAAMLFLIGARPDKLSAVMIGGAAVWAVLATACISCVAVRKEWIAALHGVLVGAAGSAGLLLFSLLFWSWYGAQTGIEGGLPAYIGKFGFVIIEAVFLALFFAAGIMSRAALNGHVGAKKPNLSWGFYLIFALMVAGGAASFFAGTDKARYDHCRFSRFQKAERFFEGRFLEHEKYWERWKRACGNCDADELRLLTGLWHPKREGVRVKEFIRPEGRTAGEQLMDALLKEREDGKKNTIDEFVKEQWGIDGDEKQYILEGFARELAGKNAAPARIVAFLKVVNEYGITIDSELRKNVMRFAVGLNDIKDMRAVWAEMDKNGKEELAERILNRVSGDKDFSLVKGVADVESLIEIAGKCSETSAQNFWTEFLENQVDRAEKGKWEFHKESCLLLERKYPDLVKNSRTHYYNNALARELSKDETAALARIIECLKDIKTYNIRIDSKMLEKVMGFAVGLDAVKDMNAVWAELDEDGKEKLSERILGQVRGPQDDFSLVKDFKDMAYLIDIAGKCSEASAKDFWTKFLENQVVRGEKYGKDFHEKACQLLLQQWSEYEKLVDDSRKSHRDRVTKGEIDTFQRLLKGLDLENPDKRQLEELLKFLQESKHLHVKENGYQNDWLFWLGYAKKSGNRDDGDWGKCFDAFLNLQDFKFKETRDAARRNRGNLAKMLVGQSEDGRKKALQLWKKCLEDDDEIRDAYRGILRNEQDPAEFGEYFLRAARSSDAGELRTLLKERATELKQNDSILANIGNLLKLFDGKSREIPSVLRSRIEAIDAAALSESDRLELVKYYLSDKDWKKAREILDPVPFDKVKDCVGSFCKVFHSDRGEMYYRLALIDPAVVDEVKRRLDSGKFELSDLREKFESTYNGNVFVPAAVEEYYPEAIFVTCLARYFGNLRSDAVFDIRDLETALRVHHFDSKYVRYLSRLKEAAGL